MASDELTSGVWCAQVARHAEQARIQQLEAQGMIKHFQDKWRVEFDKRKKLHNTVRVCP